MILGKFLRWLFFFLFLLFMVSYTTGLGWGWLSPWIPKGATQQVERGARSLREGAAGDAINKASAQIQSIWESVWGRDIPEIVKVKTGTRKTVAAKQKSSSQESKELSPGARDAFNRGKIAARGGDWEAALGYFSEAHAASPKAPQVLYAVAVALKNLNKPVPATAFLQAYLEVWPDAPNAARVKEDILAQEVFIGRLVKDLFNEARVIVDKIPNEKERKDARFAVIEKMALAGEMDLIRKMALEHPLGMPLILGKVCLKLSQIRLDGPFPYANGCFKLAESLIPAEAALRAKGWGRGVLPVPSVAEGVAGRRRREEELRRKEPQFRRMSEAEGLISLSISMNRAGYQDDAFRLWKKGEELFRQNEFRDGLRLPEQALRVMQASGGDGSFLIMDKTGVIGRLYPSESRVPKNIYPRGYGFEPSDVKHNWMRVRILCTATPWVLIAKKWGFRPAEEDIGFARANRNLVCPDLKDPAFTDLVSLINQLKRGSLRQIPVEMAELGLKFAGALWFLKHNQ